MSEPSDVTDVTRNLLMVPERTVKPRTREWRKLTVTAVHGEHTLDEDGHFGSLSELIGRLPHATPTLFVAIGSADLLARMDHIYSQLTPNGWQFRISNHERDIVRPDGVKVAARVTVAIHYFGWKNGNYHKLIDPVTMYGRKLDDILPDTEPGNRRLGLLGKLLKWGISLRDFCDINGIEVRPTNGSISAQLLTDPRFYPNARRKVPASINDATREYMPGNFYRLDARTDQDEYTALYIDQTRAHHYHARNTALPDANLLYAHGRFLDLAQITFDTVPDNFYGLFCLDLVSPTVCPDFTWLPYGHVLTKQFIFSNEIQHLVDMGYRICGVRAAWGSRKRDLGLPRYATWATQQLDEHENAAWLKPLLLSAYGVLATRPRYAEAVFKQASSGIDTTIRTGRYQLSGKYTISTRKLEPRIANVIHRGMIEAATRSESVGLAQHLANMGYKVLSIYADAVIIQLDETKQLPPLPKPWRIKHKLTHLQFLNQQAFISGEMTKLPGVGGRDLLKHTHRSPAPRPTIYDVAAEMEFEESITQMTGGT
ncbi:MAG: hypothetical protein KGL39_32160 [Patescibacteria group bacterium]|nr:hypothetical protein [Patescibacteria group bacterium]